MRMLTFELPSGEEFGVPVDEILLHHAAYYADREFDGNIEASLNAGSIPYFDGDDWLLRDWASHWMTWAEVQHCAQKIKPAPDPDMQEAWFKSNAGFVDFPDAVSNGVHS